MLSSAYQQNTLWLATMFLPWSQVALLEARFRALRRLKSNKLHLSFSQPTRRLSLIKSTERSKDLLFTCTPEVEDVSFARIPSERWLSHTLVAQAHFNAFPVVRPRVTSRFLLVHACCGSDFTSASSSSYTRTIASFLCCAVGEETSEA
jgi:hypothetical protein